MNQNIQTLLETARQRALETNANYAGSLTPREAFSLLKAEPASKLIDVRTVAERDWVGRVSIPEAQHANVQWSLYPGSAENQEFLPQLQKATEIGDKSSLGESTGKDRILLFLCRSGVRSKHAAEKAAEQGYRNCFDILEGFEGEKDAEGHRKTTGGWCQAELPWIGA